MFRNKFFNLSVSLIMSAYVSQSFASPIEESTLYENITKYGAVSGDNIDDSAAFKAAIAAAAKKSKKVLIPAGTFDLDKTVTITKSIGDSLVIEGAAGWNSIVHHRAGMVAFAVGDGNPDDASSRVSFRNFKLIADQENPNTTTGIFYYRSHWGAISNMRFENYTNSSSHSNSAIRYSSTWNHSVKDSVFVSNDAAVTAETTQIATDPNQVNALNVENCLIEGVKWSGIKLNGVANVNIINNTIEGDNVLGNGVNIDVGDNVNVRGNYFEGFVGSVVSIEGRAYNLSVNISNNRMAIVKGGNTPNFFIESKNVAGLNIDANMFYGKPSVAFIRFGDALWGRNVAIGNNTIFPLPEGNYWDSIDYFITMDPNGGSVGSPFYYGYVYDQKQQKWIYGSKTNL